MKEIKMKRLLVACEYSGRVRDAFTEIGWDSTSCDLLPTDVPGKHYQGNVEDIINDGWDMMIAFPPCTYLCVSGMHWTIKGKRDPKLTEDALCFVKFLMDAPINKIAIENPVGVISTRIRKPDCIIQPYDFGDPKSKKTCLWLKNLPPLLPTDILLPPKNNGGRWKNQDKNGQNIVGGKDRWKIRSKTYPGIAKAMAKQWG